MSVLTSIPESVPVPAKQGVAEKQSAYVVSIVPAVMMMAVFFVFPALWAIYASTTTFGTAGGDFVGLDNYRRLWNDPDFPKFVRNSVLFAIGVAVIGQTIFGLALALLISRAERLHMRLASFAYAAVLTAWITPPALAGFIWGGVLAERTGMLNAGLEAIGLPRLDPLGDAPMLSVIIAESWRGVAFALIIFLGALRMIPAQIDEAARVDGANAWRRLWDHTLPSLRHVTILVLIMTTITALGSFILLQVLTGGGPAYATETISLHAYHSAFTGFEIGYGAAYSVVLLVMSTLFALAYLGMGRLWK